MLSAAPALSRPDSSVPVTLRFVIVAALAALALTGCPKAVELDPGCKSDLECQANESCAVATGKCLCIDDNACDFSEFCNLAGSCQTKLECLNNTDCDGDGSICDTTSGECLALSASLQCVLDSQCPYGSTCEDKQCQTGCRDDGDCTLGTPCIGNVCDETPGACSGNAFCEFGQLCTNNRCANHPAANQLCQSCGPNDDPSVCPTECLIDSSVPPDACTQDSDCVKGDCVGSPCFADTDCDGGRCDGAFGGIFPGVCTNKICRGFFCGAEACNDVTAPCPRGYSCFVLQVVSNTQCTLGSGSTECGAGRNCNGGGENGAVGFCSCAQDSDCPDQGVGEPTTCVNPGPGGSCVVGTTCGPSDGLLCEDLR